MGLEGPCWEEIGGGGQGVGGLGMGCRGGAPLPPASTVTVQLPSPWLLPHGENQAGQKPQDPWVRLSRRARVKLELHLQVRVIRSQWDSVTRSHVAATPEHSGPWFTRGQGLWPQEVSVAYPRAVMQS